MKEDFIQYVLIQSKDITGGFILRNVKQNMSLRYVSDFSELEQ